MWKTGIMSYTGNSQRELCKYPKQVHKQECGCRKRELTSRKQKAGTSHVQKEATPPTPAQANTVSQLITYTPIHIWCQCFVVSKFSVDVFPGQCAILLRTVHCKSGVYTMHNATTLSTTWLNHFFRNGYQNYQISYINVNQHDV